MLLEAEQEAGPNWASGLQADRGGAARCYAKRHCWQWAQPEPLAVNKLLKLRVNACASRHRLPRDPLETAGASGPEELRDLETVVTPTHTDVDVTQ